MAFNLTRTEVVKFLRDAGIEFEEDATMTTLRPIYDQAVYDQNTQPNTSNTTATATTSTETSAAEATVTTAEETAASSAAATITTAANTAPLSSATVGNLLQMNRSTTEEQAEIERQIALLHRKRELLQLQRELQDMETRRFRTFESMVNKFTGDDTYDIDKWFDDLEDALTVFKCSNADKLASARALVDGTAKVFLRTIRATSYEDLKMKMKKEFQHTYSAQEVCQQMRNRVKKPDESIKHYVSIIVEIASHAK